MSVRLLSQTVSPFAREKHEYEFKLGTFEDSINASRLSKNA